VARSGLAVAVIVSVLPGAFSLPDSASAADKLSSIFNFDMLNVQPAFLENITGPARSMDTDATGVEVRDYRVDGCQVQAFFEKNLARRYALVLTPKCNFNLGAFVPGYASTKGLTVGKFADGQQHPQLRLHSDCIYNCGNAADPSVDFTWEGPHSVNFVYVALTVTIADTIALGASQVLEDQMSKNEGQEYLLETKFNCDRKYDEMAVRDFAKAPVNEIVIGFAGKDACQ
jgi:hypothetical protein